MAVRLHVVASLHDHIAVARNDRPNKTAGEGSFGRTVAYGAAGVGICLADVLERVVGVWG